MLIVSVSTTLRNVRSDTSSHYEKILEDSNAKCYSIDHIDGNEMELGAEVATLFQVQMNRQMKVLLAPVSH